MSMWSVPSRVSEYARKFFTASGRPSIPPNTGPGPDSMPNLTLSW